MNAGNGNRKSISSVVKAAEILSTIAGSELGLGVTEIGQQLKLGVSSTHHIVRTLKSCGLVAQDPRTKKYFLGFELYRICSQAKHQNLLANLSKPYLERLSKEIQETANLAVLDGGEMVCVAQSEGPHMSRIFARIGIRTSFNNTAGGKLLVALQPKENWDALIRDIRFEKYTENTILRISDLIDELEATQARGYGVDNEEQEIGVICIAAPLYNNHGEPIASISISGPTLRLQGRVEETAAKLRHVAGEFSAEMGYNFKE